LMPSNASSICAFFYYLERPGNSSGITMGHGKNKQKNQKVGFRQEPKETREQRRRRIAEEARAKEDCLKILPYVFGIIFFFMLAFGLYVHSLPVKKLDSTKEKTAPTADKASGLTFEEAMLAEMGSGDEQDPDTINLDGESL